MHSLTNPCRSVRSCFLRSSVTIGLPTPSHDTLQTDAQLYSRLLDEGQSVLACKFAFITANTDLHQKALDCITHMNVRR